MVGKRAEKKKNYQRDGKFYKLSKVNVKKKLYIRTKAEYKIRNDEKGR